MHLSQAGVRFSSTLWHHFISAPSYLLRQAWQSVRSSTIIVSLLNQSNSYYVLSVAFRSENDDGQQHLEADNYLTLELAEEGRTFSRNIYLNFNVIFFFFFISSLVHSSCECLDSWSWLTWKFNWMADVRFEVIVVKGAFCWLLKNCRGLEIAMAKVCTSLVWLL